MGEFFACLVVGIAAFALGNLIWYLVKKVREKIKEKNEEHRL